MEKFAHFCQNNLGMTPIKIPLPNKTRVAGTFRMYEALLRSHVAVEKYVFHKAAQKGRGDQQADKDFDQSKYLNHEQWQQLAEYSAIYEKTTSLVMDLQSDTPASLSIAKLQLTRCLLDLAGPPPEDDLQTYSPYQINDQGVFFKVVSVNKMDQISWPPTTLYRDLQRTLMCLPDTSPTSNDYNAKTRTFLQNGVPVSVPTMMPESRNLIERLMKEMAQYFKETLPDEMVCMVLNPFVYTFGFVFLSAQNFFDESFFDKCKDEVRKEATVLFGPKKETVYAEVETAHNSKGTDFLRRPSTNEGEDVTNRAEFVPAPNTSGLASTTAAIFRRMQHKKALQTGKTTSSMTLVQKQEIKFDEESKKFKHAIERELSEYSTFLGSLNESDNDPFIKLILKFPSALAKEEIGKEKDNVKVLWEKNFCPMDAVYSTKRFDIVKWWMDNDGGGKFKYLQGLAVAHLSQPYTNAFIERVFSRGTWVDAARSQRTLDRTFEMRVLDADNRKVVEMAKPLLDKKDMDSHMEKKVTPIDIQEAIKRFATPLDDGFEEDYDKTTGLENIVRDKDDINNDIDSDNDEEEDEIEEDKSSDTSFFRSANDEAFQKELGTVLNLIDASNRSKQQMKSSMKKPPPSS
jgi:hypothetical protein